MKNKFILFLFLLLFFGTAFSFGQKAETQTNKTTQNTNLKFYLNNVKKTPLASQKTMLVKNNIESLRKIRSNFKTNNSCDLYGNFTIDGNFIDKKDLIKDWSLIFYESNFLDTVKTFIVFDKDENKEYTVAKTSNGNYVFDFGRDSTGVSTVDNKKKTESLKSQKSIDNLELKLLNENKLGIAEQVVFYKDFNAEKQFSVTNKTGDFTVKNISSVNDLSLEILETPTLLSNKKVYLAKSTGNIINEFAKTPEGTFKYTLLPSEIIELAGLPVEEDNNQPKIIKQAEFKLSNTETHQPIANQKVLYNNASGKKQSTVSNTDGDFIVENISEKNFTIELEKSENLNSISSIRVSNKEGATITEIKKNNNSSFEYTFLPNDFFSISEIKNEDNDLSHIKSAEFRLTESETQKPISNQKVLYNNASDSEQSTISNANGNFIVENINATNFEIELENNPKLSTVKSINLSTKQGEIISKIQKSKEGTFKYTFLKSDLIVLQQLQNNEDISMKIKRFSDSENNELKVKRQIYFELGLSELSTNAKKELDEIVALLNSNTNLNLEIIAHTDVLGDDNANLILSEKRAKNAMNYLISKGIKPTRLKSKGMGETDILNQCKNNITCTELEHAVNRRTEFIFVKN